MMYTTHFLVSNIQNVKIGYTQSDEITLLLTDWEKFTTDQWFSGKIQKMVSVSAAMATKAFNFYLAKEIGNALCLNDLAEFDARVFNLPNEDVCNNFIWRQQDATRNSVQMLGHHYFSQKQMHGKSISEVQDMLMLEYGINWNDIPTWQKRGTCVTKADNGIWIIEEELPIIKSDIGIWIIDEEIPIFTQNRYYIEKYLK